MNISREEKKSEALTRMALLGIYPPIIKEFQKDDTVAESAPPLGACYWINDEQLQRVKDFEEQYDALVYHVVHSYTSIGEMENFLYVSDHKEEWERDREDALLGEVFAYVCNLDMLDCSEFGQIGIERTLAAGLKRTW